MYSIIRRKPRTQTNRDRDSLAYREWRRAVLERDNWTCQHCGVQYIGLATRKLQADHIRPFASHPELRFTVDNGRTLCGPCHRQTTTYGRRPDSASEPTH